MRYVAIVKLRSALLLPVALATLTSCTRPRASPVDAIPLSAAKVAPVVARADVPPEAPPSCEDASTVHLFVMPGTPWTGVPLRVVALTDHPVVGDIRVLAPGTEVSASSSVRHGGPPYFWIAEVPAPIAGRYTAELVQRACEPGQQTATLQIDVARKAPGEPAAFDGRNGLWPAKRGWTRGLEDLYSAWIETLFDAPDGEQPSWASLQEVLADRSRNLLFDYLGAGEDSKGGAVFRPDCADLPYFLRAYFAFKLGLPFGVAECNRGGGGAPPSCNGLLTNEDPPARKDATSAKAFRAFLNGVLADRAHSGSARAPFGEESADYYPVALSWEGLRPGTVYADPYGHVLVVAKRLPQTRERGGILLAVDGQPDGTVARKRFWRGNFLYANARELGGPGFKRFRPLARREGHLVRLDDEAIRGHAEYGDLSRDASKLDIEDFYDRMDDVLSPRPLDPEKALVETMSALEEQVRTRIKSVDNGRKWLEQAKAPADMPDGAEIFETTGAWEDFATPSRDLRLLIAIDVVRGFPARVARRPERYTMTTGKSPADVKLALERVLYDELRARTVTYTRSDGSPFTLTLAEVLSRATALEVAYDLNDCVELRWGAKLGSLEASTCTSQAAAEQRARMETCRAWFHERRRPPRK